MVPTTRSQLPSHHDSSGKSSKPPSYYTGYYIAAQLEAASAAAHGVDDLKLQPSRMADDDNAEEEAAAAGTSSQGGGGDYEDGGNKDWLRLGLGAVASSSSTTTSSSSAGGDNDGARAAPIELDLLAGGDGRESARMMSRPPLFPLPIRSYHYQYGHGRYRPTTAASGSMTPAPPFMPFARPLRSCFADLLRVVSPPTPRTEAAGLWLTLQAAPNQGREPILPQIPKSYLRIRDTSMKVEVVLKYLAEKLGLSQSHQVELTCRGHLLPPFLQMRYVRDCIWRGSPAPSEEEEAGPPRRRSPAMATATTDHVMILFYSISVGNH